MRLASPSITKVQPVDSLSPKRLRQSGGITWDDSMAKVSIITGGASGIGAATAALFAREGAAVCIGDIQAEQASSLATDIRDQGGRAIAIEADVSKPQDAERLVEETVNEFGALHILNNNAGIVIPGNAVAQSLEEWDQTLGVNLNAIFYCSKYAIPHVIKSGGGSNHQHRLHRRPL